MYYNYPLHSAAKEGDLRIVQFYSDQGTSLNDYDCFDWAPIHYATYFEHYSIVEYLITKNCNIDCKTGDGISPLYLALQKENKKIAELLVFSGADIFFDDDEKWTLLHYASYLDWVDIAEFIINDVDINAKTDIGYTPLLIAVCNCHLYVTRLLIYKGADINACNDEEWRAIHFACTYNCLEMVECLVNCKGIDLNARTGEGDTPLFLASLLFCPTIVALLIKHGALILYSKSIKRSILHEASRKGWVEAVKYYLEHDTSIINSRDKQGHTPLHYACAHGQTEVVKVLLDAGGDINAKNRHSETPLNYATRFQHNIDLIRLCLENDAHFTQYDFNQLSEQCIFAIRQSAGLSTHIVINEYNNKTLPKLYLIPCLKDKLPAIAKLQIKKCQNVAKDQKMYAEKIISRDKCYPLDKKPSMALKILATRALVKHFPYIKKRKSEEELENERLAKVGCGKFRFLHILEKSF